jgi:hypothetical protein
MDRGTVHLLGPVPQPSGQKGKAIFLDGSTAEVTFRDLNPQHDPALGVFYTDQAGNRWRPVHVARMTADGQYAGGPGWFEPLEDEELPENE